MAADRGQVCVQQTLSWGDFDLVPRAFQFNGAISVRHSMTCIIHWSSAFPNKTAFTSLR